MMCFGCFSITQSKVQMPVGPAPMMRTVSSSLISEILSLIEQGMIDTTPLITHRYSLEEIEEAYRVFENREEGVIKIAVKCSK